MVPLKRHRQDDFRDAAGLGVAIKGTNPAPESGTFLS
jgi:hypothetical protein